MKRAAFFDTNVFLYADDASSRRKQATAVKLITDYRREDRMLVSLQVLQEYFAAGTRKLGLPAEFAQRKVEIMSRMRVVRFDEADVISAIELHRLHQISFGDAMIVHAARVGGAEVLYSEDLQAGKIWGSVTVVNPFVGG